MKFSYDWLQSYFKEKLPKPEKLAEVLTMHSFETEWSEDSFDMDVLPNRAADCYSHLGIAKEIATLTNCELRITNYELNKKENLKTEDHLELEVKDQDLCPRYMALLVKNVKVGSSPKWLQERLISIDQKPINNIVDIANYVMFEIGQPLHAFDLNKIGKRKIIVRQANYGEKIETLDDKKVVLEPNILVIADDSEPLAIAGIKGGKKAEITQKTEDIIIESAVFDSFHIRQNSQNIGIKTDASIRFEHGISMFLPEIAIWRMAELVQEIAQGEVAKETIDFCVKKPTQSLVDFNEENVEKLLGIKIGASDIEKILKSLNLSFSKENNKYTVTVPKERLDIKIKEDVIEEIARIYGYENIPVEIPGETKISPEENEEYIYSNWIRGILAGLGFSEVYNYSFCQGGDENLKLKNPVSSDKTYLRTSLLDGLNESIKNNFKNFDEVKLFEIGKTFYLKEEEITSVAVAIGDKKNKIDVEAELKGVADALFIKDADNYIKENVFEIGLNLIIEAAKENGLPAYRQGIDLSDMPEITSEDVEYKPFSRYPAIIRDISLFVPVDTKVVEIMDIIENTAGELLIDTDLFDEYTPPDGENKSFAFRLIFQSFEKTLKDIEVNEIMDKIISALEENIQWQVRKK